LPAFHLALPGPRRAASLTVHSTVKPPRVGPTRREEWMARKRTLNYRELRSYDEEEGERRKEDEDVEDEEEDEDEDEEEATETEEEEGEADEEDEEEVAVKPPPKKKKAPAKPAKPKRSRAGKVVRVRVVWGVFNNSN